MSEEISIDDLLAAADNLGRIAPPPAIQKQLTALCETARLALGAAAVSIASTHGDSLRYEAAAGEGADQIIGVEMPITSGVAGYVATTGQGLSTDKVAADPRFARDVALSTGYIPSSLLVTPIVDDASEVVGVLTVLDRTRDNRDTVDSLAVATSVATQAALVLPSAVVVERATASLLEALAEAAGSEKVARRLRARARSISDDRDLRSLVSVLAQLRRLPLRQAQVIERIVVDAIALTRGPKR